MRGKMKVEHRSFIHRLSLLIKIQAAAMVIMICLSCFGSYNIAEQEQMQEAENFLEIYASSVENGLEAMDRALGMILYNNSELMLLQNDDYLTRHYASLILQDSTSDFTQVDSRIELIVIAQSDYDICLSSDNNLLPNWRKALEKYTMQLAEDTKRTSGSWETLWLENKAWVCRSGKQNSRAVTVWTSLESLLNINNIQETSERMVLWSNNTGMNISMEAGEEKRVSQEYQGTGFKMKTSKFSYDFAQGFTLNLYESKDVIYRQMLNSMAIMAAAVLLLFLFTLYVYRTVRLDLIEPMKSLTEDIKKIRRGDYELRIKEEHKNEEFYTLSVAFNRLLDEIIHLKIQDYEKKLLLQEANQKYIQLQLRPHFFLNAMTTVSGLSAKNKNKEIQIFINALSKNIRYMFSSGLHTVAIRDEIQHLRNYLEMQDLKYPDCVFSYIDLPEELGNWKIPQMIIHTLIENEYRYAVSMGKVLMILIKVSSVIFQEEPMLLIEIEDDGNGYPEEIINAVNEGNEKPADDGKRIGLWSIRRLMELMYEREGLFVLSNIVPHGAMSQIYVPENTIHEVSDKREDWGILQ